MSKVELNSNTVIDVLEVPLGWEEKLTKRPVFESTLGCAENGWFCFSCPFRVVLVMVRRLSGSMVWGLVDSNRASRRPPQYKTFVFATSRVRRSNILASNPPVFGVPNAPLARMRFLRRSFLNMSVRTNLFLNNAFPSWISIAVIIPSASNGWMILCSPTSNFA